MVSTFLHTVTLRNRNGWQLGYHGARLLNNLCNDLIQISKHLSVLRLGQLQQAIAKGTHHATWVLTGDFKILSILNEFIFLHLQKRNFPRSRGLLLIMKYLIQVNSHFLKRFRTQHMSVS